jgi:hypothetical protein
MVMVMASVYTKAGRYDDALDELEYLLSITSPFTARLLAITPDFAPLRDHPRFQALIEKYEKIHGT